MKIVMVRLLQRKNFLSLLLRKPLQDSPGQGLCQWGEIVFTTGRNFYWPHLYFQDLIHLRKNYSSIGSPVWWPWSLELQIWKKAKRGHCHALPTIWTVLLSRPCSPAPKGFLEWSLSNIWWTLMEWKKILPRRFFLPHLHRSEGIWPVSLSTGQDLHPKCSWYRILVFDHKCWRVLSAYMGFWALAA